MKNTFLPILIFQFFLISKAQSLETRAAQSPAIFASSVHISYGVSPHIIRELDALFAKEGMASKDRKEKVVQLVAQFQLVQNEKEARLTIDDLILNGITDGREVARILIKTTGPSAPAIYAKGDVSVAYGINEKLFWALYDILDRERIEAETWETQFRKTFKELKDLEHTLSKRSDGIAKEAKKLLIEGKFEEAKKVLRDRIYYTQQKTQRAQKEEACSYADYANFLRIELDYDSALILYRYATKLDNSNSEYANELGLIYYEWQKNDSAIIWIEQSLSIDSINGNFQETADCFNNLGVIHQSLGDFNKAISYYNRALCIDSINFGMEHPEVAIQLNNLGGVYNSLGDFTKAKNYYKRALHIDSLNFGMEHHSISIFVNGLGSVSKSLGEYNQAISYYKRALQIDSLFYGIEHPKIAIRLNNLGLTYQAIDDYAKAIDFFEAALRIDSINYGMEHPKVATRLNNLGLSYYSLGAFKKAIVFYYRALRIDSLAYGMKHFKIATKLNNIGSSYHSLGEFKKAFNFFNRALYIDSLTYGMEHPKVAIRLNNLGGASESLGAYTKAMEYYERALCIDSLNYGMEHPVIAIDLNNLGLVYKYLGLYEKAIAYFNRALYIDSLVYGMVHSKIAIRLNNLGSTFVHLGEYVKAISYYEDAFYIDSLIFGIEHPKLAIRLNHLGSAYHLLGSHEMAIVYFTSALDIFKAFLPPSHQKIKMVYLNLCRSATRYAMKFYEAALWDSTQTYLFLAHQTAILGQDSSLLITCKKNLGSTFKQLEAYDSALIYLNEGIQMTQNLGLDSPIVFHLRFHKASTLWRLGDKRAAKSIFKELKAYAIKNDDNMLLEEIKVEMKR